MSSADPFSSRFEVFGRGSSHYLNEINQDAFARLKKLLDLEDGGDGRVILLRAPRAGFGKTSLLQRLSEEYVQSHYFVRVNLVGGRTTDAAHVLEYVLQALCHVLPDSTTLTDLDLVARKILALGLEPLVASGEVPCQDREGALAALRDQPAETFDFHHERAVTAHWTKSNFEILGPRLAAELGRVSGASLREASYWVELLFRFATTAPDNVERARLLFETVFRGDLQNQSESAAEERLHGLLALLGTVTRLVLIVDDTEGLSTHPPDALALSSFLTNVSQCCPGTLVLLSVNKDVWETAFLPLLPGGLADRLTEYSVSLDPLSEEQARELIRSRAGDRAEDVLDKIEWPEEDMFSRQILKIASDAWELLEDVPALEVVDKESGEPAEEAVEADTPRVEIDELPDKPDEPAEDDAPLLDRFGSPAALAAAAVVSGGAAAFDAKSDQSLEDDEDEGEDDGREMEAGKADTPPDDDMQEDDEIVAEATESESDQADDPADEESDESEPAVNSFLAKSPDDAEDAEASEEPDTETAISEAEEVEEAAVGEEANPFVPASKNEDQDEDQDGEPDTEAAAELDADESFETPDPESEQAWDEKEEASSPFAEKEEEPVEAGESANPFTALDTATKSEEVLSPFAAGAAPDEEDDPSFVANVGELIGQEVDDLADTGDEVQGVDETVNPFTAKTAAPEADAEKTGSPFAAKTDDEVPGAEERNPFLPKPAPEATEEDPVPAIASEESPFAAKYGDDSGSTGKAPVSAPAQSPFAPKPGSEPALEKVAAAEEGSVNPFDAATDEVEALAGEANPFVAKGAEPAAPPAGEGNDEAKAETGLPNTLADRFTAAAEAAEAQEEKRQANLGDSDSPSSDAEPVGETATPPEESPAATPPPVPQDSPFAAGPPAPPAPPAPPDPVAKPAEPASPFAALGGNAGGEKGLAEVSSIFSPIQPPVDPTLDAGKLKPLLDRTDDTPVVAPLESDLSPGTGSIFQPSASGENPFAAGQPGPPPTPAADSGTTGPSSLFKPIASTPNDSPFAPGAPAGSPPQPETASAFGSGLTPPNSSPFAETEPGTESKPEPGTEEPTAETLPDNVAPAPASDSPFKPIAAASPTGEAVSPFAKGETGSLPEGLAGQRTELPPKKVELKSPPGGTGAPSPFEPGSPPSLATPAPPSAEGGETPFESPPADSSPFATVGKKPTDPPASIPEPATAGGGGEESSSDQDKVDELLRQFKERYGRD